MQTLKYTMGNWNAEAQLEEVETGKLMAVIMVTDREGNARHDSKHTVVFEHRQGMNKEEETRALVHQLLQSRYGL